MKLKSFQEKALNALDEYLRDARLRGPRPAFDELARRLNDDRPVPPYREMSGFASVPYVCLRLPTGGGKTFLASHAVGVAARAYAERQYPVVLWLVPTKTIRTQTLDALKNPSHPYRQTLDAAFGGRVGVFDISEVTQIRPQDLTDRVCIIVGTLASLRVRDQDGRRLYDHSESFEEHFRRISPSTPGLMRVDAGPNKGDVRFSFANLLYLHRPIVIMDEAHNARTHLTFETLERVNPSCVVELTATPDIDPRTGSNVLLRVSAAELKAEEMIKLPIVLTEHQTWQDAVYSAIRTRAQLAEMAKNEADFVRPIALLQAESRDQPVPVDVLRRHLIENEKIDPERIAVATGDQRELDGINLFDPACKIDFVITIEALKEGWDCSFAYVFCSVANVRSSTDVEQLLGRVLRMPYAKRRKESALNRAYAHVSSPTFAEAAVELRDRLVAMGFEGPEAEANIEAGQPWLLAEKDIHYTFPDKPFLFELDEAPDLTTMSSEVRERVDVKPTPSGKVQVTVSGEISDEVERQIVIAVPVSARERVKDGIARHRKYVQRPLSPAERGAGFAVPRLCVWVQGELELANLEVFLDAANWTPLDYPTELPDFRITETAEKWEIDVIGQRIVYTHIEDARQLSLGAYVTDWTDLELARWLDRECRQIDVSQPVMLEFIRRTVGELMASNGIKLADLVRFKFPLAKSIQERIKDYRRQAISKGYQQTLFATDASVEVSFNHKFSYDPNVYPSRSLYRGAYRFQKHFYRFVGDLDAAGEEFECARTIDTLQQVRHWVRNIEREPKASFWLPTSTDNFYPDFVAELADGRLLVVEYKGAHLWSGADSAEKRSIGALWESKSAGKALFLMARAKDDQGRDARQQILQKIGS